MKLTWFLISIIVLSQLALTAQEGGNSIYGAPKARSTGPVTGDLFASEPEGSVPVSFIEANVLMNVKADQYQAVFALAQEGPTLLEGNEKIAAQTKDFVASLEALGVRHADIFVDFVSQNRVYDFTVADNVAREKLSGFEVKKNIIVRYEDRALLEKMLAAAAKSAVFDLVKVDYVVSDMAGLRARLLAEASKIIKQKEASYQRLFGVRMRPVSVYQEKYNAFFPSDMYKSYVAYESGSADSYNLRVVRNRKTSTFYYSPLDPAEFDAVINPAGVEPVVQLTLYLKMKYR
jgi:uncharacterized protein YggE